jgi:hypothetical protein
MVGAVLAARDVAAERRRAAVLDRRHRLQLAKARLTWPALASRQAGPWARKISATSRTGRATGSGRHAGASCFAGFKLSRSSGLVTSRIVLTATRV